MLQFGKRIHQDKQVGEARSLQGQALPREAAGSSTRGSVTLVYLGQSFMGAFLSLGGLYCLVGNM
jgi:hypothetical protein